MQDGLSLCFWSLKSIRKLMWKIEHSRQTQTYSFPSTNTRQQWIALSMVSIWQISIAKHMLIYTVQCRSIVWRCLHTRLSVQRSRVWPACAIYFMRDQSSDKLINFLDSKLEILDSGLDSQNFRESSFKSRDKRIEMWGTVKLLFSSTIPYNSLNYHLWEHFSYELFSVHNLWEQKIREKAKQYFKKINVQPVHVEYSIYVKKQWMSCQQSDTTVMRKELWDRQGANISSCWKEMYRKKRRKILERDQSFCAVVSSQMDLSNVDMRKL